MRALILMFLVTLSLSAHTDTIDHYMNIASNIPVMEMKADAHSQAWARSAKNVLIITNETIAETLIEANRLATQHGRPLFCLPENVELNATTLKNLIESTYQQATSIQNEKDRLTVSQVAWIAVSQSYACHTNQIKTASYHPPDVTSMKHEEG